MATKTRIEWYRSPVENETLRALTQRSDWRGFCQVVPHLLLVVGTGYLAWYASRNASFLWVVGACYLHATVFNFLGLAGAGHELSHGTVFRTRFLNEVFLRIVYFLTWNNFVRFRASHAMHHQYTVFKGLDLEVVLPQRLGPRDWFNILTFNWPQMKYSISQVTRHARGIIRGELEERLFPESNAEGRRQLFRWARFMWFGHVALAAVFLAFHQWLLLFLVTLAPFYGVWLCFLCGFPQHVGLTPSVPDFRLCARTVRFNPLFRFLYWNMNYHVEHHMFAAVPFFNLPKLRSLIKHDLPAETDGLIATWRLLVDIMRRQKNEPGYTFIPTLPESAAAFQDGKSSRGDAAQPRNV